MKLNNIKIAVTGGIGSGKSTVCKIIEDKGYPVFSCDEIYSELLQGKELLREIVAEFGENAVTSDGKLNREYLSARVFNDKNALERLNKITHSKIFEEAFKRAESKQGLVFFEVPLLFEGGNQKLFDEVLVILRDENERISSVSMRDNISVEMVKKRILSQYNYNREKFVQYYVIHNCGKIDDLSDIINVILSQLTSKYKF